jgi:hypothetical protein
MLVYYSQVYPTRSACQRELTAALLSAQVPDEIARRILVVDPEPGESHIGPVELRDLRFQPRPRTKPERKGLARHVAGLVTSLPGRMGASVPVAVQPRWWPSWPVSPPGVVGRYPVLWRLHSALRAGRFPLTERAAPVGVAVVSGMPGIGKATLAEQYALEFGAAYPGGIARPSRIELIDERPDDLLDSLGTSIRLGGTTGNARSAAAAAGNVAWAQEESDGCPVPAGDRLCRA